MGICQDVSSLWFGADAQTACAVCMAESRGDPTAHNTNGEDSRGIFQINVAPNANPGYAAEDLFDPWTNARVAHEIWQARGWQPWTTYTGGAYQQFLGQCGGTGSPAPLPAINKSWLIPALIGVVVVLAIT